MSFFFLQYYEMLDLETISMPIGVKRAHRARRLTSSLIPSSGGQPSKRRAEPLNLADWHPAKRQENFQFGYAVKDDSKGDDFSHQVIQNTLRIWIRE